MGKSNNALRVVIDTNILVSAVVYGGIPKQVLALVIDEHIVGVTTRVLVAEFMDVLSKKFYFSLRKLAQAESLIEDGFIIVQPEKSISVLEDDDDNRVLEAAVAGTCHSIVTGDMDLLRLKHYRDIPIVTPADFLKAFDTWQG